MAAEAVISVVVEQLITLLAEQAKGEIDLLTGVEKKVRSLLNTMKRIQLVLDDAEQRQIKDKAVKAWLQDLEDVSFDIDDVLDDWFYKILKQKIEKQRVRSLSSSSCFSFKQVGVRRSVAKKIKKLTARLDLIEDQKNQFSFLTKTTSDLDQWKPVKTSSLVDESKVFGRVSEKNELVNHLLSMEKSEMQVVSIVGTGGIGKTTLAQLAYNDGQVRRHFEKRGWVCVSDTFDETVVANAILESMELSSPNLKELDPLLQRIKDSTSGKRLLIVFDDVWTADPKKWEPFYNSLRYGAPGSTILLTTRGENVAKVAGATCIIPVNVLSDSESWSMFRQVAFFGRTEMECERFENIGKEIARKCKGLPLAIKTMGSLLLLKKSLEEWQSIRDSNIWELEVAEVKLFPHLYLSYKDLSPLLKRCFSYCAVFPKDSEINIDDLIRIWIAQGYLNSTKSESEMELKAREYFDHLAMRSLFQNFQEDPEEKRIVSCKMHDIVHDFAQFVRKGECKIIEQGGGEIFSENLRHITWIHGEEAVGTLLNCNTRQCRSFFGKNLKLKTPNTIDLLNSLKRVRVLKLDDCGLEELPKEIGTLTRLRYLGLSDNEKLKELPTAIYNLYNLQTLDLQYCPRINELPPGIEKLTKLRHLLAHYISFPVGISEVTCLQTLGFFAVGGVHKNKLGYLKNLNRLGGLLYISFEGNLDGVADVENANLNSKKHIQYLMLSFLREGPEMDALNPPPNLQRLTFNWYLKTQLPLWITSLNNLRHLHVESCIELTSLPQLGLLPSLEELAFLFLLQLRFVGLAFLGIRESLASPPPPAPVLFPKLTTLKFYRCDNWEEWEDIAPGEAEDDDNLLTIFPRLKRLVVNNCPKLKAFPHRLLGKASSLECIELEGRQCNPSKILSMPLLHWEKLKMEH